MKQENFDKNPRPDRPVQRYRAPVEKVERCVLSVLTENEPGALARVIGLFAARGYNIDSLCVAVVDVTNNKSKITIVTSGTPTTLTQIKCQLDRIVPVAEVQDLTTNDDFIERELALIKVVCNGQERVEAMRLASIFRARIIDSTLNSFVIEVAGRSTKIDALQNLLKPLGLKSSSRTGVAAMFRA